MPHTHFSDQSEIPASLNRSDLAGDQELDLDRVAEMVATGQMTVPTNMSAVSQQKLLTKVSRLRRDRLLRHIANVIASDIVKGGGPQD